jgi:hypothetical protein
MVMTWKRHADGDQDHRETLAVTAWMKELASLPSGEGPLPDPTYLWLKAEILRRWDAQQRATAPIEVGERVQVGVGLAAAAGLLIWLWRTVPGITLTSTASPAGSPLTLGLAVTAVLLAATAGALVRDLIRGR